MQPAVQSDDFGPPRELVCPITQELMVEPVLAADGYTYERESIERWLAGDAHLRSPTTNAPMLSRALTPNRLLGSMIASYTSRLATRRLSLGANLVIACQAPRDTKPALRAVTELVDAGADVNARDEQGASCLALACARGRNATAAALLDAGARVVNEDAVTALAALLHEARRDREARTQDARRSQLESLLSAPTAGAQSAASSSEPTLEKSGDREWTRDELDALDTLLGRLRARVDETLLADARTRASALVALHAREAAEATARNSRDFVRANQGQGGAANGQPQGLFGAARVRQRGYFPSLLALQFALVRGPRGAPRRRGAGNADFRGDGPSQRREYPGTDRPARRRVIPASHPCRAGAPRFTFFAFFDEATLLATTSTHAERGGARRMRAGILAMAAALTFFVMFG